MKKLFSLVLLSLIVILGINSTTFAETFVTVLVNNNKVDFPDEKPFLDKNNRTMVPVRFVSQALGAQVSWDNNTRTVTIVQSNNTIKLRIGENKATVNGQTRTFDTSAIIKNSRTMVPLRFVSEVLGAKVEWVTSTKTVKITVNNGYTLPVETELLIDMFPSNDNPNKVDIGILVGLDKDLDSQYADVSNILTSKFNSKLASEVITYAKTKKARRDVLMPKKWYVGNYTIEVASDAGNIDIAITVWQMKW